MVSILQRPIDCLGMVLHLFLYSFQFLSGYLNILNKLLQYQFIFWLELLNLLRSCLASAGLAFQLGSLPTVS
jgi:hypothetical protein